ncbi:penicillin-binding protein [Rhodococcus rhodnii]|uniref:Penicillin-binding protein n=2 Tax=Rhodococcus rhodnii TaxID=38312 RepID=R7WM04_9NOCA|nr:penicillin-binding transpeptidase domain-containing protein [Rhodococcus rhodnii]EOM76318.1 penicillin-binding protein [Rhodococcus rhodnii LMG 5362]TXG89992.1 penicillin-binding protein [Rhodococcus rhodnii]
MIGRVRTSRVLAGTLTGAIAAALLTACGGDSGPEQLAEQFADALVRDDAAAAAGLTTDPAAATETISALFAGLGTSGVYSPANVAETDDGATFDLDAAWNFGSAPAGGERLWEYTTNARATDTPEGWRIDWDPAVLAPGASDTTTLRYTPTSGTPAPVLTEDGRALMSQQTVTLVQYDQTTDLGSLAGILSTVVPTITPESLAGSLADAQGAPATAVALRESDLAPIRDRLAPLSGIVLVPQARLLTDDKDLSSPLFGGITDEWQRRADEAAGWAVQSVAQDGTATTIAGEEGRDVPALRTTLDLGRQQAAQQSVAAEGRQAALVAIRPSTGEIVAMAQNDPAAALGPIALTGLYPPGSTFKTVTTAAALGSGEVTPDTVLPCPGTENIEGRQIPNDDNFDLGAVPLHTAFAQSCNTTMGRLAVGMEPDRLQQTALSLGLGIDYTTPALTTVTGSVPPADTPAARVETAIGQGAVTASPFGMALVAAAIANGTPPAPSILAGEQGTADQTPAPLDPAVLADVREMMRETVANGTASSLARYPDLLGKTGTAEDGTGSAHGWFVGIRGDLAFAVFVADGDSSAPALQIAGSFLE